MKLRVHGKHAATLAGTALVTTLGAGYAAAGDQQAQGFAMQDVDGGYLVAAKADSEGKCGEGKCGGASDAKESAEGKCGEGKCGGAGADAKGSAEGKCGEGKCGGANETKDSAEGKCGEGKCGGAA